MNIKLFFDHNEKLLWMSIGLQLLYSRKVLCKHFILFPIVELPYKRDSTAVFRDSQKFDVKVEAAKFQIFRITTGYRTSLVGSGWQRYARQNDGRSRGPLSDNEDDPLETPSFLRPDE